MKVKNKLVEIISRASFLIILLILFAGLVKTVLLPEDINVYENRYANKISPISLNSYLDGSFQNSMDEALSDQVPFSTTAKKAYNAFDITCAKPIISALGKDRSCYVWFNGSKFFGDNILYQCYDFSTVELPFKERAENLNNVFAANPELNFYLYYIEKDTDIDFLSGEKPDLFQYLRKSIELPDERIGKFEINSFDEFEEYFYKTDHHWNYRGSYKAYTELASMLGFEPLKPVDERTFSAHFYGSKSFGCERIVNEELTAYNFDFPEMDISINGKPAEDYGTLKECFQNGVSGLTNYGIIYGGDCGCVEFDTHNGDDNLLILGESYDNAILKLIAAHFNKTYGVDLRYYAHDMGESFDFDKFIREHDIDTVLLIGNVDYYLMKDFMVENY